MEDKSKHIRTLPNPALYVAVEELAAREGRTLPEQARHLLYVGLGLDQKEDDVVRSRRAKRPPTRRALPPTRGASARKRKPKATEEYSIRFRAEPVLRQALDESAARAHRNLQGQAHYILCVMVGLDQQEDEAVRARLSDTPPSRTTPPSSRRPQSA